MLLKKEKKIKKIVFNGDFSSNDALIYNFLVNHTLDDVIKNITPEKTKCIKNTISNCTKKGYLTCYEQFLDILNNTIARIKHDFYFLGNNDYLVISFILENKKENDFLLSKKYWGDNNNMCYFMSSIKKYVVYNFYDNLCILSKNNTKIKLFLENKKLDIYEVDLSNDDDVDRLYELLRELALCNAKEWNILFLFSSIRDSINKIEYEKNSDYVKLSVIENYIIQYTICIKNYNKKIKAIKLLL